jgi:probable F420-dependent oxidoreductase
LTWVAAATSRVTVLTRVLAIPYRSPAVTAKMAETLDRLSDGRVILGLGAGYLDTEFKAFGLEVPSLRDKIDGMAEAVRAMRGLWSERPYSFEGRRYSLAEARLEPAPMHEIPIWLGTYGPRALRYTGQLADGWIPSFGFAPPEKVVDMMARVRDAAEEAGRDRRAVKAVYNIAVEVGQGPDVRGGISGSPAAIAERLHELASLGFDGVNLIPSGGDKRRQIEELVQDVLPALRERLS